MIADDLLELAGRVKRLEQELHEEKRANRFLRLRLKRLEDQVPEEQQETPPWEVLGLGPTATAAEVQAAFRGLSKELHPDATNGDREAFEKVVAAKTMMLADLT